MMNPLLTIITASFNSEKTIAATIQSVLDQNFTNCEYILIDGNSTDNTVKIIKTFETRFAEKSISLTWISEKDTGIYDAWNKGLKLAKGQWITFIGSDDVFLPGALSLMAQQAEQNTSLDFICAKARIMRGNALVRNFGQPWNWNIFKREMKILHAGGWHNSKYFERFGMFDTAYKIVGDYEMLLRAGKDLKVHFVDEFIVEMGDEGVSSTLVYKSLKEAQKARVKNKARNSTLAMVDFYWVLFKIKLKAYAR
jgi:glycosyltransferase involved in cell wall biosynthesis